MILSTVFAEKLRAEATTARRPSLKAAGSLLTDLTVRPGVLRTPLAIAFPDRVMNLTAELGNVDASSVTRVAMCFA